MFAFKAPYIAAALINGLPESGTSAVHARNLVDRMWLLSLSSTVIIWLKVVFMAAVVWLATLLGTLVVTFRTVFAGLVYCEIAPLVREIVELAMCHWRGLDSVGGIADLQFRWGLNLVLPLPSTGVLAFSRPQRHHPHEKEMMHMIAQLGAIAWHNLTAYRHVKVAADVDELTGIFNKRALKFRLSELVYEARQAGGRASVFLFDIDHFKNYNDLNGHIAGDELLRRSADLIVTTVRKSDLVFRFGGDEFVVLLRNTTGREAEQFAARLVEVFQRHVVKDGQFATLCGVSVGVAPIGDGTPTAEVLLATADRALYQAKQQGKGRVVAHRSR